MDISKRGDTWAGMSNVALHPIGTKIATSLLNIATAEATTLMKIDGKGTTTVRDF